MQYIRFICMVSINNPVLPMMKPECKEACNFCQVTVLHLVPGLPISSRNSYASLVPGKLSLFWSLGLWRKKKVLSTKFSLLSWFPFIFHCTLLTIPSCYITQPSLLPLQMHLVHPASQTHFWFICLLLLAVSLLKERLSQFAISSPSCTLWPLQSPNLWAKSCSLPWLCPGVPSAPSWMGTMSTS